MFDKSYFETLQNYVASGCSMELTAEELDYYNVLADGKIGRAHV